MLDFVAKLRQSLMEQRQLIDPSQAETDSGHAEHTIPTRYAEASKSTHNSRRHYYQRTHLLIQRLMIGTTLRTAATTIGNYYASLADEINSTADVRTIWQLAELDFRDSIRCRDECQVPAASHIPCLALFSNLPALLARKCS